MKKCDSCFRYIENSKDAKQKGLKPRHNGIADYYFKPRKEVRPHGMGYSCPEEIKANHPACESHEYRWITNIKTWYTFRFKWSIQEWLRVKVKVPLGGLRKPIPLEWKDHFDGRTDTIIKNGEPLCPRCKEMPYSTEQCVFCGQRFKEE